MLKKITTATLLAVMVSGAAFAQTRDFKAERAELNRQERLEKQRYSSAQHFEYKKNILSVSPLTAMDIGVGLGMSYERIFGKEGLIGVVLPVSYIMEDRGAGYFTGDLDVSSNHRYVYFTPGLKVYPFGQRRVTYAVGPSLMFGHGGGKEWRYYQMRPYSSESVQAQITKFRFGMLINNYVNFQITPLFNLGLNAGFGIRYIDRQTEDSPLEPTRTIKYQHNFTGQASLTMGFRF